MSLFKIVTAYENLLWCAWKQLNRLLLNFSVLYNLLCFCTNSKRIKWKPFFTKMVRSVLVLADWYARDHTRIITIHDYKRTSKKLGMIHDSKHIKITKCSGWRPLDHLRSGKASSGIPFLPLDGVRFKHWLPDIHRTCLGHQIQSLSFSYKAKNEVFKTTFPCGHMNMWGV